jgi:hypothetical protein
MHHAEESGMCDSQPDKCPDDPEEEYAPFNISKVDDYNSPAEAMAFVSTTEEWERVRSRMIRNMPDTNTAMVLGVDPKCVLLLFDALLYRARG